MPPRCFLGCPSDKGVHLHVFPNPIRFPEQFNQWVQIVGGSLTTDGDYAFYRKQRLCDRHFTENDRNRNNRLNAVAVPSLFLKGELRHPVTETVGAFETVPQISMDVHVPLLRRTSIIDDEPAASASALTVRVSEPATEITMDVSCHQTSSIAYSTDEPAASASASTVRVSEPATEITMDVSCHQTSSIAYSTDKPAASASSATVRVSEPATKMTMDISCHQTSSIVYSTGPSISTFLEHNYSNLLLPRKYNMAPIDKINRKPILTLSKYKNEQNLIKGFKRQIKVLRQRCNTFKSRLESASKMSEDKALQKVTKNMSSAAKLFTNMQYKQTAKKPSGRRFSLEEKILSLSLYKRSPKCYALLAHCFTLPSKKTLKAILAQVKLGPGINNKVFKKLKKTVKDMNVQERLCSLIFDEMHITPQINFDMANDKFKGFVSMGTSENDSEIADHVLVFMVKGLKANFKQPVAYFFTNRLTRNKLKNIIEEVVQAIQATDLIPLCSVCDQSSVNVGAITDLVNETKAVVLRQGNEWRYDYYEIKKLKIIPLYDVPHLLKGLRNNLLTKDLLYRDIDDDGKEKIVKWEYFRNIYEADKTFGELRLLHKITEEHINPEKIKKMRVKLAAQIFSHSVAVVTEHLTARGILKEECRHLIPLVALVDNLFDSLNSSSFYIPNGKIYKGCVKKSSPHHRLWTKAKIVLKSVKFVMTKKTGDKIRLVTSSVPTTNNFIKTIEGFEALWYILNNKYNFDCMLTRHFNQDPVENFFGNIRSYGARNNSPNAVAFEGAFKALLLNNFNSPHSVGSNCEKDENKCLQTLDFFLAEKEQYKEKNDISEENFNINLELLLNEEIEIDLGQRNYVCGWVVKKCLTNVVKGCVTCKSELLCDNSNVFNEYIRLREYNKNKRWQTYPSKEIVFFFYEVQRATVTLLKRNVPKANIRAKLIIIVKTLYSFPCTCKRHSDQLFDYFVKTTINVFINSWCRQINRILSGKMTYEDEGDDEIKKYAQLYFNKHKHK